MQALLARFNSLLSCWPVATAPVFRWGEKREKGPQARDGQESTPHALG